VCRGCREASGITNVDQSREDGANGVRVRGLEQEVARLRASEAHYRRLFESAPVGAAISDEHHAITEVNPALAHLLGVSVDALIGKRLSDYEVDRELREGRGQFELLVAGKQENFSFERHLRRADGGDCWVLTVTNTIRDDAGNFLHALRAVVDITDQKRTELELRAIQRRSQLLFDSAAVGILVTGAAPGISETNPALQHILGYTEEELRGTRFGAYWYPGYEQPKPGRSVDSVRTGDADSFQEDRLLRRSDGSPVWVRSTGAAMRDDAGQITDVVTMVMDITEHRKAEEALREREEA
jgi:two-component system sensor histidine kinase/response regulator